MSKSIWEISKKNSFYKLKLTNQILDFIVHCGGECYTAFVIKKSEKLKNDGENYDSNTILASHCEKEKNIFSNYNYLVHIPNFTS